jgi:glycerate kinase
LQTGTPRAYRGSGMRVLAAFDKFKDSISAPKACEVAAGAIASAGPGWSVDQCPLADGGDGFAAILTRAARGSESRIPVTGPRGGEIQAGFGIVPLAKLPAGARALLGAAAAGPGGTIAVVEMAAASGLALLAPWMRDPLRASSAGTGQLIRAAGRAGPRAILLGVGGSATHDLGLGALSALGVEFLDGSGARLDPPLPADWPAIRSIEGGVSDTVPPILIACDVDNPLLGPGGALAVYGPQKGLRPQDAGALEAETARMAAMLCARFGRPESLASERGAGAAGGIAFGLMAAAGARLLPGFDLVASWLELDARLAAADIAVTGEGRFDDSSLSGKGPGALVRRALGLGKPVHVFAGQVALSRQVPGLFAHSITPPGMALSEALAKAPALLDSAVRRVFPPP